jgi:hypothetical protein
MDAETIIDPLGNYVGFGCHNCHNETDDGCLIRLEYYDDHERKEEPYLERMNDVCPDWQSRFVPGYRRITHGR